MFDKQKFSDILNKIIKQYDSITEFSTLAGVGRSYISKFIHLKISTPPSPKVLKKISNYSKGIASYEELMNICGHFDILQNPQNSIGMSEISDIVSKLNTLDNNEINIINDYIDFIKQKKKNK